MNEVTMPVFSQQSAVNLIIDHLEYLLRRHDCVTVPGIGAIMVRQRAARFDSRNPLVLLPPARELAFNGALVESDGILETSVARRCGISFEAAARMVKEEADSLLHQLRDFGALMLGHLGELTFTQHQTIVFTPSDASEWDFRYYGLRPLYLRNADSVVRASRAGSTDQMFADGGGVPDSPRVAEIAPWTDDDSEESNTANGGLTRKIVGIAASLAVIVTLALFIINPIKIDNEPLKASMAPVGGAVVAVESATPTVDEARDPADEAAVSPADTEDSVDVLPVAEDVVEETRMKIESDKSEPADMVNAAIRAEKTADVPDAPVKTKAVARFSPSDPFCVIVASFPDESQAERYIAENQGKQLGILPQDGKYRVYAATGDTYEAAAAQKALAAAPGAWICRR